MVGIASVAIDFGLIPNPIEWDMDTWISKNGYGWLAHMIGENFHRTVLERPLTVPSDSPNGRQFAIRWGYTRRLCRSLSLPQRLIHVIDQSMCFNALHFSMSHWDPFEQMMDVLKSDENHCRYNYISNQTISSHWCTCRDSTAVLSYRSHQHACRWHRAPLSLGATASACTVCNDKFRVTFYVEPPHAVLKRTEWHSD